MFFLLALLFPQALCGGIYREHLSKCRKLSIERSGFFWGGKYVTLLSGGDLDVCKMPYHRMKAYLNLVGELDIMSILYRNVPAASFKIMRQR